LRWRDGSGRLTRVDPRYAAARFQALKVEALLAGPLRGGRRVVRWGGGPIGKGGARALGGARVAAFVEVAPGRIGQTIHGAPVVGLQSAGEFPGALHLAAVGHAGARQRTRRAAQS